MKAKVLKALLMALGVNAALFAVFSKSITTTCRAAT